MIKPLENISPWLFLVPAAETHFDSVNKQAVSCELAILEEMDSWTPDIYDAVNRSLDM